VLDHSIEQQFSRYLMHHLVDSYNDAAGRIRFDLSWLHVRIEHTPLPRPVGTDTIVTVDCSALHPVRPINVRRHRRERTINVAHIKGGIGFLNQFDVVA